MTHPKERGRPVEEAEGDARYDETADIILMRNWIIIELYVQEQREQVWFFSVILYRAAISPYRGP